MLWCDFIKLFTQLDEVLGANNIIISDCLLCKAKQKHEMKYDANSFSLLWNDGLKHGKQRIHEFSLELFLTLASSCMLNFCAVH